MQRLCALIPAFLMLLGSGAVMAQDTSQNPCLHKQLRTAAQKKIASSLLCEMYPAASDKKISMIQRDDKGRVLVDIRTTEVAIAAAKISELSGDVTYQSTGHHTIEAYVPFDALEKLAELPQVRSIQPKALATTNPR